MLQDDIFCNVSWLKTSLKKYIFFKKCADFFLQIPKDLTFCEDLIFVKKINGKYYSSQKLTHLR